MRHEAGIAAAQSQKEFPHACPLMYLTTEHMEINPSYEDSIIHSFLHSFC